MDRTGRSYPSSEGVGWAASSCPSCGMLFLAVLSADNLEGSDDKSLSDSADTVLPSIIRLESDWARKLSDGETNDGTE